MARYFWAVGHIRRVYGRLTAALLSVVLLLLAPGVGANEQAPPLNVVASFSILADMVKHVGGQHIALSTIVGPDSDAHTFEPSPRQVKALASAQVLVVNGLNFETWLAGMLQSAQFKGEQVVASAGIVARKLNQPELDHGHDHDHDHGDIDPHAWQSLGNGVIYVQNIAAGLAQADPAHAADYYANASHYIARIQALDQDIKTAIALIPPQRRKVITSHDAFAYFAQAYGIQFISAAGAASQAEPSAKDVAAIIDRVRQEHIAAVFIENVSSAKLVSQIARETGAKVGGTLYSDALAQPGQPAATYLGMMRWNADQLIAALN
ncbi:zinc ABC transporter substrate-binding protein [Alcaligenaceae bacterium]|nr:zinc ABC transporter substrate-binding protein [Alcaligenaceae bacterium]